MRFYIIVLCYLIQGKQIKKKILDKVSLPLPPPSYGIEELTQCEFFLLISPFFEDCVLKSFKKIISAKPAEYAEIQCAIFENQGCRRAEYFVSERPLSVVG